MLRAQTLSLRKRDFVEAARANGESTWRIITAEILPNLTAIIAAGFVGTVGFAVLSQITLSFIGITPTDEWNWGTILYWAQAQLALQRGAWWWFVPAGLLHRPARHGARADQLRHRRVRQPAPAVGRPQRPVACASARSVPASASRRSSTRPRRTGHERASAAQRAFRANAAATDPVLEIKNLSVDYGYDDDPTHVLRQVSLTLNRGEVLGLAGESGCGKSTLAYAATRLLPPPGLITGGEVIFTDRDRRSRPTSSRSTTTSCAPSAGRTSRSCSRAR